MAPDPTAVTTIHNPTQGSDTRSSTTNIVPETGSSSGATHQQKSRAKDLLRKHYGLGIGPPPPKPVGSNSQDPMDMSELSSAYFRLVLIVCRLDSSAFDAKSYYEQLITTSSLPVLLKRENELLSGEAAFC